MRREQGFYPPGTGVVDLVAYHACMYAEYDISARRRLGEVDAGSIRKLLAVRAEIHHGDPSARSPSLLPRYDPTRDRGLRVCLEWGGEGLNAPRFQIPEHYL